MSRRSALNTDWVFAEGFEPGRAGQPVAGDTVTLPHTAVELPLNYFDETSYQRPFTYQRRIDWQPEWEGQEVSLVFDGAMADSIVWINGQEVVRHADGYTPFTARLTPHLQKGENLVTVHVSGAENPEIPPFGGQIDYLTYAGIYRDVWLQVVPKLSIGAVKVETPDPLAKEQSVRARVWLDVHGGTDIAGQVVARLRDAAGVEVVSQDVPVTDTSFDVVFEGLEGLLLWSLDNPVLYTLDLELVSAAGTDRLQTRFGLRTAEFTPDGFLLNGKPMKLMGLNRHQSFPYSGSAQGRRSQERDADILRFELGCNIVRTSHYPQSPWFLDRCDEIGLLVFEEIPGWQHIGDAKWQAESVRNVERMIRRDWNHPSVVIWGVRINESADNHDFYAEANRVARSLDTTRQTGGVRCITDSELLEDVYTMNDFILGQFEMPGSNRPRTPLRPVAETTGLERPVPYLVTEYNGHMYPTKSADPEQRQAEHVIRHLEILNATFGDPKIAGCIGWCMFDYNTHKDFGAGDRICHHGVTTIFREPKFAAYAYASQRSPEDGVVMKPVTYWTRGERNIGGTLPLIVLTNCDEVELAYGPFVKRVQPDRERFPHLPHAPVIIDQSHFSKKELGSWGMSWEGCRITGYIGGKAVAEQTFAADPVATRLEAVADTPQLVAVDRDEVRVLLRGLDQAGNPLPFLAEPVSIELTGPAELIGPPMVTLTGGSAGFWLRATGTPGKVFVRLTSSRFPAVEVELEAL